MFDIDQLRTLDLQRPDMEELIFMSAVAGLLRAEFEKEQVDVPEWLDTRARELKREVRSRQQDSREKRRKELTRAKDALKTPAEKRAEIEQQLAELDALAKA